MLASCGKSAPRYLSPLLPPPLRGVVSIQTTQTHGAAFGPRVKRKARTTRVSAVADDDGHEPSIPHILPEEAKKLLRTVRPSTPVHKDDDRTACRSPVRAKRAIASLIVVIDVEQTSCSRWRTFAAVGVGHIEMLVPGVKKPPQQVGACHSEAWCDQRPRPLVEDVPRLPAVPQEVGDASWNDTGDGGLTISHKGRHLAAFAGSASSEVL